MEKIGFGGSCHWCTEAIFLSLKGVTQVDQGWIASNTGHEEFSEAVIVHFNPVVISLARLIAVHLYTHSCTSTHQMRTKYRSAVYVFDDDDTQSANLAISELQKGFSSPIITAVLPFKEFKINTDQYLNYYYSNPEKPFCENIVNPKLRLLLKDFAAEADQEKLEHLR